MKKHWLQTILDEYNTTAYAVARTGQINKDTLYRILHRSSSFLDLNISTVDAIARGLGLGSIKQFLDLYWDNLKTLD